MTDVQNTEADTPQRDLAPRRSAFRVVIAIMGIAVLGASLGAFGALQSTRVTAPRAKAPESDAVGPVVDLEPFITNLMGADDEMHYLKCRISIELVAEDMVVELTRRTPRIRHEVLLALSGLKVGEALGTDNKRKIHDRLRQQVSQIAGDGVVRRVYLTEFVIQ